MVKEFNLRSHIYLLFSTPLVAPPTLHLLCFLPMRLLLLMGHREVINSQHSVSESAHQRRAGLKHSQIRILLIPPKRKISPWATALTCLCVCVCLFVKEREGVQKKDRE